MILIPHLFTPIDTGRTSAGASNPTPLPVPVQGKERSQAKQWKVLGALGPCLSASMR